MHIDFSTDTTRVTVDQIATPSLGNHSYIVTVDGQAAVIDPQRDIERFEAVMTYSDARLIAVLETHIHNDYVSGGYWLADLHDAVYVLPENSGAPYPHRELSDGESIRVGPWQLIARDTPGHTFHHTSYVLAGPDGEVAVFTGGSMLVGAVGRSDLLGAESTDELLAHQYRSVRDLSSDLGGRTLVAPTHGAGSFCSASAVGGTTSTIEAERLYNPACSASSEAEFLAIQRAGYGLFPSYYSEMAGANLLPTNLAPAAGDTMITLDDAIADNCDIVDCRNFRDYAAGHVTGSISVPPSGQDATYLAWTLPWNTPIAIVGDFGSVASLRTHLVRIGWDRVVGRIDPSELLSASVPMTTTRVARFTDVVREQPDKLIDARDPSDHREGIIEGAIPAHVSVLATESVVADQPVWVHCQSGYRASVAVGLLERQGCEVTAVVDNLPVGLLSADV